MNPACAGLVGANGVLFAGGTISTLLVCDAELLRTSRPASTRCGLAQVRRLLESPELRVAHVVFAPAQPRPLLLGLVRLESRSEELLQVAYTELWDLPGANVRAAEGSCLCDTPDGARALADVGLAVRGRAPDPLPRAGLALELKLFLPPGERRTLAFAYVAPEPGEEPAALVRAWRGSVEAELRGTVRSWRERLGEHANSMSAYRVEAFR